MATTTRSRGIDPELMTSRMFAQVFQAYVGCTEETQRLIRDMVEIVNDPSATEDEQLMACSTIAEALFPSRHGGHLGVDLEEAERLDAERSREIRDVHASMDRQEEHFADRVIALMRERDMTQTQLASACEIGQPAVSNLLSRWSRPQRRTVEKIAKALGVEASEIWPEGDTPA
jgi:lambda repressor-like predicted transcriptional regulator